METFFTLVLLFGGIPLWFIAMALYDVDRNNIELILMCLLAFIPIGGIISMIFFLVDVISHSPKRDNKVNRFLFNKIDWNKNNAQKHAQKRH